MDIDSEFDNYVKRLAKFKKSEHARFHMNNYFSEDEQNWIVKATSGLSKKSIKIIWLFLSSKDRMPFSYQAFAAWVRRKKMDLGVSVYD